MSRVLPSLCVALDSALSAWYIGMYLLGEHRTLHLVLGCGIYGGFTDHERDRLRRRENPLPRPARESYVPRKANGHPIACGCCRRAS